jgi:hypothetical protein
MHGLEIKDDDGKMMKAFLLQHTNNMYLISRFSQVAFCTVGNMITDHVENTYFPIGKAKYRLSQPILLGQGPVGNTSI